MSIVKRAGSHQKPRSRESSAVTNAPTCGGGGRNGGRGGGEIGTGEKLTRLRNRRKKRRRRARRRRGTKEVKEEEEEEDDVFPLRAAPDFTADAPT